MFYNTFLEHSKNYNYTCKNISFGCLLPLFYKLPPPKALLRPSYGACVRVNLLYSVFVYILEKRKLDREKNCLKNL